jgi:hypothetical protein
VGLVACCYTACQAASLTPPIKHLSAVL